MPTTESVSPPASLSIDFVELAQAVAARFGQPIRYFKDCDALATAVLAATDQRLSTSTLRRLFGLMPVTSRFGRHTLDVLSRYAGHADWQAFAAAHQPVLPVSPDWARLQAAAAQATAATLAVLRERTGLPPETTVVRSFGAEFWAGFQQANTPAAALVAEGGAGKSVLLLHLAATLAHQPAAPVLWMLPAWHLRAVPPGLTLPQWLLQQAGLASPELPRGATVYLLVDGLDEAASTATEEEPLFRLLAEAVAMREVHPWLRLVVTSRPVTWAHFSLWLEQAYPRLKRHWHGQVFEPENPAALLSNVPPLLAAEVQRVVQLHACPQPYEQLTPEIRALIAHPYYLQLWLQAAGQGAAVLGSGELALLQEFMRRRVRHTRHAADKHAVLQAFAHQLSASPAAGRVERGALLAGLSPGQHAAYAELLADGVLRQEQRPAEWLVPTQWVAAGHDTLGEYLVAEYLAAQPGGVSFAGAQALCTQLAEGGPRLEILKWLFLLGCQQGHFAELVRWFELPLTGAELTRLGQLVGQELRVPSPASAMLGPALAATPAGQVYFVERFVDLAQLSTRYGALLTPYLAYKATAEAQLFGHSLLFLRALLTQDAADARRQMTVLRNLPRPAGIHAFPLGRAAFAELTFAYFLEETPVPPALGPYQQQALAIPRASVGPAEYPASYHYFPAGYHLLVAEALFLTAHFSQLLAWLEFTLKLYPELATYEHNLFNELLRGFRVVALGQTGRLAEATEEFAHLRLGSVVAGSGWLGEYYSLHWLLVQLHHARALGSPTAGLQAELRSLAALRQMPFFARLSDNAADHCPSTDTLPAANT